MNKYFRLHQRWLGICMGLVIFCLFTGLTGKGLASGLAPNVGAHLVPASLGIPGTFGWLNSIFAGLDPTFSGDGWTSVEFFGQEDYPSSLLIQPDNKLIMSGYSRDGISNWNFTLARFNADGSLDDTFGIGGQVILDFGGREYNGSAVLQPDGKIVISGQRATTTYESILARINSDGSLDTTFGAPNGYVLTDMDGTDEFRDVTVQADGKIVAAGNSYISGNYDMVIARYNPDGSLDTTFATPNGYRVVTLAYDQSINAMLIQSDGSIVLVGYTYSLITHDFFLARFTSLGDLDTSFGSGGMVITDFAGNMDHGEDVIQQPDNRLIVAGVAHNGVDTDVALARYNLDGSLDTSFANSGLVMTDLGAYEGANSLALSGEQIVVAGEKNYDFLIGRYDSSGNPDPTFGTGGFIISDLGASQNYANSVLIQPDGRIVASGIIRPGAYSDFAIARYITEPTAFSVSLPIIIK